MNLNLLHLLKQNKPIISIAPEIKIDKYISLFDIAGIFYAIVYFI
ncbi:MAG: hypothetical protein QG635_1005 [Bacteroidota bacterium]|nr:hypothetical protein [Bacteroidota bacterium]